MSRHRREAELRPGQVVYVPADHDWARVMLECASGSSGGGLWLAWGGVLPKVPRRRGVTS